MNTTIGVFDAKSQLSSLLDRAAAGEEITITKHGKPVAKLVSARPFDREKAAEAMGELLKRGRTTSLGGLDWKALRDEGRR